MTPEDWRFTITICLLVAIVLLSIAFRIDSGSSGRKQYVDEMTRLANRAKTERELDTIERNILSTVEAWPWYDQDKALNLKAHIKSRRESIRYGKSNP